MFSLRIALRYLFSKKSTNAINIISYISMAGMGVGAFALIVVLSVFNGFEGLIKDLYNAFYPELIVTPAQGKIFDNNAFVEQKIKADKSIVAYTKVLEENAYLEYEGKATIATIKGVDSNYTNTTDVADYVRQGSFYLSDSTKEYAVLGANINLALNTSIENNFASMSIRVPKLTTASVFIPEDAFNSAHVVPAGIFSIQQEFDSKYVLVSLPLAQQLIGIENAVSAFEVKLKSGIDAEKQKKSIQAVLGKAYKVQTREELNEVLYRVVKMERWAVFAILSFILVIISFNIVGSLTMLAIEKTKDISILKAMGANPSQISTIFLLEGVFVAMLGAGIGLLLGLLLCFVQINYGIVKLAEGGASFVVDAYPVKVIASDILLTFFTVAGISLLAALVPAIKAAKQKLSFA
jgi:lipoprotein-releasing system permease protein